MWTAASNSPRPFHQSPFWLTVCAIILNLQHRLHFHIKIASVQCTSIWYSSVFNMNISVVHCRFEVCGELTLHTQGSTSVTWEAAHSLQILPPLRCCIAFSQSKWLCVCPACRRLAEEPERAGEDEKVPAARGAGVPHGPDGHSGAAGGAGEELPDHLGRLQEDPWEAGVAGLIGLAEMLQMTCPVHTEPRHQHRPELQPREASSPSKEISFNWQLWKN